MIGGAALGEALGADRDDAIQTDAYLEMLLAGAAEARGGEGPAGQPAALVDPAVVAATRVVRATLNRVHPSFRFEERLASRLQSAAEGPALPRAVGAPIPFRRPAASAVIDEGDGADDAPSPGVSPPILRESLERVPRPLLIGGAIASGVSLAGAALVALRWRERGSSRREPGPGGLH